MDQAAESPDRTGSAPQRPGDAFLGEEGGAAAGASRGRVRWIVDPIDGTVNYLYGMPDWAVSIAAEVDGEVVAGVVAVARARRAVHRGARRGRLARTAATARREAACNAGVPLERALVATGFGYQSQRRARQAEVLLGVLPRVRDIRRGGSAAVDLCSVAAGPRRRLLRARAASVGHRRGRAHRPGGRAARSAGWAAARRARS